MINSMFILFGIPNCDTVKKARTFLEKKKVPFEFVDFKKNPPQRELIKRWAEVFGGLPVNKKGLTYKKHAASFEKLSNEAKIDFLIQNPSMIKRPILQKESKVYCFGFDSLEFDKLIGE
jgi:Spx/MgsR family transcriptional regulator